MFVLILFSSLFIFVVVVVVVIHNFALRFELRISYVSHINRCFSFYSIWTALVLFLDSSRSVVQFACIAMCRCSCAYIKIEYDEYVVRAAVRTTRIVSCGNNKRAKQKHAKRWSKPIWFSNSLSTWNFLKLKDWNKFVYFQVCVIKMKLNAKRDDEYDNFADSWTFFMSHFSLSFKQSKCVNISINTCLTSWIWHTEHTHPNQYNVKMTRPKRKKWNGRKQFSKIMKS